MLLSMSCECQMLPVRSQMRTLQLLSAWQYMELKWQNGVLLTGSGGKYSIATSQGSVFISFGTFCCCAFVENIQSIKDMAHIITKACTIAEDNQTGKMCGYYWLCVFHICESF